MSDDRWRECTDPEELAAAVADGVEVQVVDKVTGRRRRTANRTEPTFGIDVANGWRFFVPSSWEWEPCATDPCEACAAKLASVPDVPDACRAAVARRPSPKPPVPPWPGAVLSVLPPPPDVAMHDGEPVEQWRYDALVAERDWLAARLDEADAERTKLRHKLVESMPPIPPWPGAVLSGLTDEDGVPTWLAQAGQVRGEQVRSWHGSGWVAATHSRYVWVEVRAPRAVPEPETERVPWWEAVEGDRDVTVAQGGPTFSAWLRLRDPEGDWWLVVNGCTDLATAYKQKIAPDGTVEVLKDGES